MRNLVYEMPGEQCLTPENGGWFWIPPLTRGNACSHHPHPYWELGIHQPSFLQTESQVDSCRHWSKGCSLLSLRACLYSVFCAVCVPCMSVFCVPVLCVQSPEVSVSRSSSSESELFCFSILCLSLRLCSSSLNLPKLPRKPRGLSFLRDTWRCLVICCCFVS